MFKKLLFVLIVLTLLSGNILLAQGREGFGLGIMLGEPTGLSLKFTSNLAAGVAWSFVDDSNLHFHLDYLKYTNLFSSSSGLREKMPFYYGVGGRFKIREDKDSIVGVRVPLGISYLPDSLPIDIFLEIVPILDVVPDVDFGINSALGARYYF